MTKDEWDLIWKRYIRPEQERLWERRGMRPQGRKRVDVARLSKAMPIYREMILRGVKMKELLHQPRETWYGEIEDLEQEAIRNTIGELERLLTPKH